MNHITGRLTAKNRDQLRNPTLCNRVWAIFFVIAMGVVACLLSELSHTHKLLQRISNTHGCAMFAGEEIRLDVVACQSGQYGVQSEQRTNSTHLVMLSLHLLSPHLLPDQLLRLQQPSTLYINQLHSVADHSNSITTPGKLIASMCSCHQAV